MALYLVGALLLCFALRVVVLSFWFQRADYVRTRPAGITRDPARTGIPGLHEIGFSDTGGTRLAGWYAPPTNGAAVILVHGTGAERSSLLLETGFLAESGFGVLAFDAPGQGASEGRTRWGAPERRAISAAVDWLSARSEVDPHRIGGFGASMGAYVMTQAAVLDNRLRAVVLAASPNEVAEQNWRATRRWGLLSQVPNHLALRAYGQCLDMAPKDVIGGIAPRPVFTIGGQLDDLVPEFMARQLHAAAGDPKELWIVAGAGHVDYGKVAYEEYRRRVVDFFRRSLLR